VVELRDDDADAHNYLGLSYLEQGSHEDAADSFLLALHYHPQFPQALYNLALVALRRADLKEAVACLEQAIALKPDFAAAHNNLGYVICRELGDFERGAGHIREALRLVPDDPDALCNDRMVLIQEGRSEEALALCDQLLAANPDLHEALLNRALAALKLGRFAEAWPDYEARKLTRSNYVPRSLPLPDWRGHRCYATKDCWFMPSRVSATRSCLPPACPICCPGRRLRGRMRTTAGADFQALLSGRQDRAAGAR
jgi:tetratricopeptide (TPR) repeat protein